MRINDFNEILEKYDFFESIIDEVYFYIDPKYCETILLEKVLKVK